LTIQVIPKNVEKDKGTLEEKWSHYVFQYMKMESTEDGINPRGVFLRRFHSFFFFFSLFSLSFLFFFFFPWFCCLFLILFFIIRNKKQAKEKNLELNNLEISNNLECKICLNTYKMFFVENSEDYFYRKVLPRDADTLRGIRASKRNKFNQFLNSKITPELENECLSWFVGTDGKTKRIEENNGDFHYFRYSTQKQTRSRSNSRSPSKRTTV